MVPPIPGEPRHVNSQEDRLLFWRWHFAGIALSDTTGDRNERTHRAIELADRLIGRLTQPKEGNRE